MPGYIGRPISVGYPAIPIQTETVAYLARFSSNPSVLYKNALNQFIYECKQAAVYSLISDLWLACADAQADALRNLISAARDATITGAPTFTAQKGFSGLGATNYVSLPWNTSGVTAANARALWAGRLNSAAAAAVLMGSSSTGGAVDWASAAGVFVGISCSASQVADISTNGSGNPVSFVAGNGAGGDGVCANHVNTGFGAAASLTASPIKTDQALQLRFCAYGQATGATSAQMRSIVAALTSFLERMGALQ